MKRRRPTQSHAGKEATQVTRRGRYRRFGDRFSVLSEEEHEPIVREFCDLSEQSGRAGVWGALTRFRLSFLRLGRRFVRPRPADSEELSCSGRSAIWPSGACSESCYSILARASSRSWRSSCFGISWLYFAGNHVVPS